MGRILYQVDLVTGNFPIFKTLNKLNGCRIFFQQYHSDGHKFPMTWLGMMEVYHSCWTTGTSDSTGGWSLEDLDDLILRIVCDGFLDTALGKKLTPVSLVSKALVFIHLGASTQAHWSYIRNRHSREFGFPKIPFNIFWNSQCSCLLTILPLVDVSSHIRYPSISIGTRAKVYCPEFAGVLALRFGFPSLWIQQWCNRVMGRSAFTTDEDARLMEWLRWTFRSDAWVI